MFVQILEQVKIFVRQGALIAPPHSGLILALLITSDHFSNSD